jgi:N-acetyl-anhydromuramyl-L-alanine amidase AmpD
MTRRASVFGVVLGLAGSLAAPRATADEPRVGQKLERRGDEIVVCGQLFHTTAPVVLWTDPGGYDAYRVERHFAPADEATWDDAHARGIKSPNRYGMRSRAMSPEQVEKVRKEGWDLATLQAVVDQFVIHFDVCGTSRRCFRVLHDERGLSVHFMLDTDGTIYQTLDLKESAWHATKSNSRSVGIEIANMGTFQPGNPGRLSQWYSTGNDGKTLLTIPGELGRNELRNPPEILAPIRDEPITGHIQGADYSQYDLTPQQYDSLIKLTATLCTVLPRIRCDYPKDTNGTLIPKALTPDQWKSYSGVLGHYHVQTNKNDPGPAFQWDLVLDGARKLGGIAPERRLGGPEGTRP